MLKVIKVFIYIIVFIINVTTRFCRVRNNRITFISYLMDYPLDNIKLISEALKHQNKYELIYLLKKYNHSLSHRIKYFLNIVKQAYYFNTSKIIVLDGNNIAMRAILRKKNTITIQIWHASGALKKFGADTDRLYDISSCDYVITSCNKIKSIYSKALNVSMEKIVALGSPRTDSLFDKNQIEKNRQKMFRLYNIPLEKKLLLYAPTFRGKGIDDMQGLEIDLSKLANSIDDQYILAVRFHPMVDINVQSDIIDLSCEDLIEVLSATNLLITDYSSIIFEYSILTRPMIFFVPDLNKYQSMRGFYVDYMSFVPGSIVKNLDELLKCIEHPERQIDKITKIKNQYFDFQDGKSTMRVIKFIESVM